MTSSPIRSSWWKFHLAEWHEGTATAFDLPDFEAGIDMKLEAWYQRNSSSRPEYFWDFNAGSSLWISYSVILLVSVMSVSSAITWCFGDDCYHYIMKLHINTLSFSGGEGLWLSMVISLSTNILAHIIRIWGLRHWDPSHRHGQWME